MGKYFAGLILIMVLASCASRLTPEGGKKDEAAPVLQSTTPENLSVNFNSKTIVLSFDEYVQLVDLQSQLVVSPLMEQRPQISAYKNEITIELPDTLLPNTTYSFSFGKSIADVHESNILDGYRYVFSTGAAIDSFYVSGRVRDAATYKEMKQVTVMLYRSPEKDSLNLKKKPDYFSRTDDMGNYKLSYLAAGSYRLFALDDKNGNYVYDDPAGEAMGFVKDTITIPPDASRDLYVDYSLPADLRLKFTTRLRKTSLRMVFNRPVDSLEITNPDGSEFKGKQYWSLRRDSLQIFTKDTLQDSLIVYLKGDHGLKDTVAVRMITGKSTLDAVSKGIAFSIVSTPAATGPGTEFIAESLNPIKELKGLQLMEDTMALTSAESFVDKSDDRRMNIKADWKPGKNYSIRFLPGDIEDIYGYTNDSLNWNFTMPDERNSGELILSINGVKEPGVTYLLQLCTSEYKVVRQEKVSDSATTFAFVQPGSYILRIVKDLNANGSWDESDFGTRKQAEPVSVSEAFLVRASWTLEKSITIP